MNTIKDFVSGLAIAQNRKDFFGAIFLSYCAMGLCILGLYSLNRQTQTIIVIPMRPAEESSLNGIEI